MLSRSACSKAIIVLISFYRSLNNNEHRQFDTYGGTLILKNVGIMHSLFNDLRYRTHHKEMFLILVQFEGFLIAQ